MYITTYTKKHIDPLSPDEALIDIDDIAHALSLLCRANGHFGSFFSVAQHSINCMLEARARGYSERVQLGCLLHDASEAYLSDITRPVKKELTAYREIESRLQNVIFSKWLKPCLSDGELLQISAVDDAMLYNEFKCFMGEELFDKPAELKSSPSFSFAPFGEVENEFRHLFYRLTKSEKNFITVGVDWKKPCWLAVISDGNEITSECFSDIAELYEKYKHADMILIDIPIGLPESKEEAEKRPDGEARKLLPTARKPSVFNVLYRQLVYARNKNEAWELNSQLGAGMTSVGYGLSAMIRHVDMFLDKCPEAKNKICESHPELAFQILNGKGLRFSKHTEQGINERIGILKKYGADPTPVMAQYGNKACEDVLDAMCLAVSARLGCENGFFTVPENPRCDSKGLLMQMVFGKTQ